jgi:hypothetical protein
MEGLKNRKRIRKRLLSSITINRVGYFLLSLFMFLAAAPITRAQSERPADPSPVIIDPLIRIMLAKGMLSDEEARTLVGSEMPDEQRNRLVTLMHRKGMISDAEFEALRTDLPSGNTSAKSLSAEVARTSPAGIPSEKTSGNPSEKPVVEKENSVASATNPQDSSQKVIPAVEPLRLLPIDPPKRDGMIPDIKLGSGARVKPYGFFKTGIIYDTSSPQGNDFPLPLLANDTGPKGSPEFHLKARSLRLGAQFEWVDPAPKTVITGRLEFDFEGDFTRVNNRNLSSVRSSQPSLRLAWGRIDRGLTERLTGFILFGQDWTSFVSSTLPVMIENTNFGGLGYGAAYERIPQTRFGVNYNLGGSRSVKLQPEFAITFPAFGDLPLDLADQLGFGERQGADSRQPGMEARVVTQWQLDKAPGVVPAQFIISYEHARRTAIVTSAGVPASFQSAFPSGVEDSSSSDGFSGEVQLPTRVMTFTAKYYNGSDMRIYFGGQLLSNFNDTAGLTDTATGLSIDGASTLVFGFLNGVPTVAPQRPVRGQGGFAQIGFPLSRLFGAAPEGRNAGWTLYLYYGYDQAMARDARRFSPVRGRSDLFSGNIQYKLNSLVTFAFEQGYYRTRAANHTANSFGGLPLFRGIPSYTSHNLRSEVAAIFNF